MIDKIEDSTLYLGVDPGKSDLIMVTDGINTFRYTKGQRDFDTKRKFFAKKSLEKRREVIITGEFQARDSIIPNYYPMVYDPTLAYYEEAVLSKNSSRTCDLDNFLKWINDKLYIEDQTVYNKPGFRNNAFTSYTLKQSSEDKMINRLKKFIKEKKKKKPKDYSAEKIKANVNLREYKDVVLFYGNWGRSPNLRNSAPTPGIGLRRKIHSYITTVTVNEAYTSKTCPCCRERSLKNPKLVESNRAVSKKHHLLRCENVDCTSRWWNRNCVGSYNILHNGIHRIGLASIR